VLPNLLFPGSFKTDGWSRQYCPQEAVWIQFELRVDVSAISVQRRSSVSVLFIALVLEKFFVLLRKYWEVALESIR